MNKRAIISVMVAIMLFAVCTPPPAQAIAPLAAAWVVWGIATGVSAVAVVADETSDKEQAQANNQGQDVNDLAINRLPHPITYYELGSPTPAGYVYGVEVADSPCVKC